MGKNTTGTCTRRSNELSSPSPPANDNWRRGVNFPGNNAAFAAASFIWRRGSEFFSANFYFDPAALGGATRIWQHIRCMYRLCESIGGCRRLALPSLWAKPSFLRIMLRSQWSVVRGHQPRARADCDSDYWAGKDAGLDGSCARRGEACTLLKHCPYCCHKRGVGQPPLTGVYGRGTVNV